MRQLRLILAIAALSAALWSVSMAVGGDTAPVRDPADTGGAVRAPILTTESSLPKTVRSRGLGGLGGKLTPRAREAFRDPRNADKWIGLTLTPDGKYDLDAVASTPTLGSRRQ